MQSGIEQQVNLCDRRTNNTRQHEFHDTAHTGIARLPLRPGEKADPLQGRQQKQQLHQAGYKYAASQCQLGLFEFWCNQYRGTDQNHVHY